MTHKIIKTDNYLLVVDDSLTVGKGYALNTSYKLLLKYNTDQHLFYANDIVKKIIAHHPLNGSPILEGVDLLPPYSRHQEDGLEELAEEVYGKGVNHDYEEGFIDGYNKAREKYKYTEEDMRKAISETRKGMLYNKMYEDEYIQSLHQYPTEFECEMKYFEVDMGLGEECIEHGQIPQKITTSQGVQWVGKYK
jgi:hypothetical protein